MKLLAKQLSINKIFTLVLFVSCLFLTSIFLSCNAALARNSNSDTNTQAANNSISFLNKNVNYYISSNKDSAQIAFNGRNLFTVSSTDDMTALDRANYINSSLKKILKNIQSNGLKPKVRLRRGLGFNVITVNYEHLITITDKDVNNSSFNSSLELGGFWTDELSKAFEQAERENSNGYLKKSIFISLGILFAAILLNLILIALRERISRQSLLISIIGIWTITILFILELFPATRDFKLALDNGILKPLLLFIVCFWAFILLNRVSKLIINWRFQNYALENWSPLNRSYNKAITLRKVSQTTITWIVAVIVLLTYLILIGIDPTSVLTGAGLFGLAVGFIAQDFFKGVINGLSILLEDQFGVGDVIRIGIHEGTVEDFSLRATRLRDTKGALIVIPNKDISLVENLTNQFSQIDFKVNVAYDSDIEQVMKIMLNTVSELKEVEHNKIIDEPEMLGLESFEDSAITMRMLIKTLPRYQWSLKRELNLRIKKAFEQNGIRIPFPQREVRTYINNPEKGELG